ncbi:MAG: hypothetical protein ACO4AZ_01615 [Ilumatobacteraceae bacterium]
MGSSLLNNTQRHVLPDQEGLQHPPGWNALVGGLNAALEKISPDYKLYQTKETFGGLRFHATYCYVEGVDPKKARAEIDSFNELISIAEDRSMHLCQVCGEPAERQQFDDVYKTLCVTHSPDHRGRPFTTIKY